jgi:hypothetical protein
MPFLLRPLHVRPRDSNGHFKGHRLPALRQNRVYLHYPTPNSRPQGRPLPYMSTTPQRQWKWESRWCIFSRSLPHRQFGPRRKFQVRPCSWIIPPWPRLRWPPSTLSFERTGWQESEIDTAAVIGASSQKHRVAYPRTASGEYTRSSRENHTS